MSRAFMASVALHALGFGSLCVMMGGGSDRPARPAPYPTAVQIRISSAPEEQPLPSLEPPAVPLEFALTRTETAPEYRKRPDPPVTDEKPFAAVWASVEPPRRGKLTPADRIERGRQPAPETKPEPSPTPGPVQADVVPPVVGHNPPPAYPESARRRGQEGRVEIEVTVSAQGAPTAVRVARSSGHAALDEAAADAVRGWRFSAALAQGRPVEFTLTIPFRFVLDD
jgi:protein TonB